MGDILSYWVIKKQISNSEFFFTHPLFYVFFFFHRLFEFFMNMSLENTAIWHFFLVAVFPTFIERPSAEHVLLSI